MGIEIGIQPFFKTHKLREAAKLDLETLGAPESPSTTMNESDKQSLKQCPALVLDIGLENTNHERFYSPFLGTKRDSLLPTRLYILRGLFMQPTTRVELGLAESATNGSENDKQRFKTFRHYCRSKSTISQN